MIGSEIQKAIRDALVNAGICSGRVFDRVPENATFPYVTIGDEQVLDASNACGSGWDVIADVHIWSRPNATSKGEVKSIAADAVDAILGVTSVTGFALSRVDFESSITRREADGLTEHSALVFRVAIDPAS